MVAEGPNLLDESSDRVLFPFLDRGVAKLDVPLEGGPDGVTATCR